MAYNSLTFSIPGNYVSGSVSPTLTFGTQSITTAMRLPSLTAPDFTLWDGTGTGAGKINILAWYSGTLTSTTPGTTDTQDIDMQALVDVMGASKVMVKSAALVVLNFSTTTNQTIIIGGAAGSPATNPWTTPFADMTTPSNGRLRVQSGYVNSAGSTVAGGVILWSGNATGFTVGASNKVLRLYTAAASVPWRVVLAGRDA